jgi:hypothetical protein
MNSRSVLMACVAVLLSAQATGATLTIPSGTRIFGELQQEVSSDVKRFEVGDMVTAHVWRNVVVDGQTVVSAGTPMVLQISDITKRKAFGRGGNVELRAVSVTAVDGTEIFLDGGYDKKGENRIALSATLFALVAWPTAFIKGKEAILAPGTVFDASIPANTNVMVADSSRPTIRLTAISDLTVEVLYDELSEDSKELPIRASLCDRPWRDDATVTAVNDAPIEPIIVEIDARQWDGACETATGRIDLKDLSEHFAKGINRFTVTVAGEDAEVILDVEM